MGIGDWGLGIWDWGFGPIPNPQSPMFILNLLLLKAFIIKLIKNKINKYLNLYNKSF